MGGYHHKELPYLRPAPTSYPSLNRTSWLVRAQKRQQMAASWGQSAELLYVPSSTQAWYSPSTEQMGPQLVPHQLGEIEQLTVD